MGSVILLCSTKKLYSVVQSSTKLDAQRGLNGSAAALNGLAKNKKSKSEGGNAHAHTYRRGHTHTFLSLSLFLYVKCPTRILEQDTVYNG